MAMRTKGGRRREARRDKRKAKRSAKNPRAQYYGGSKEQGDTLRERNAGGVDSGQGLQARGLEGMAAERANAGAALQNLDRTLSTERNAASGQIAGLSSRLDAERAAAGNELGGLSSSVAAERAAAGRNFENLGYKVAAERAAAGTRSNALRAGIAQERVAGGQQYDALNAAAATQQAQQRAAQTAYGGASNQAFSDYSGGRAAVLGGADELAALGRGAQGRYKSAADAAFAAATERSQRNALSLAAGRGPDAIRTALATSQAQNQEAALAAEVTRANEMNSLLSLEGNAIQGAAGIRAGVGQQDLAAAQAQAQREQAAGGDVNQLLQQRAAITGANANLGLAASGLTQDVNAADASTGLAATAQRGDLAQANVNAGLAAAAQRTDIANANAGIGLQTAAQKGDLARTDIDTGLQTAAQRANIATTDAGLGMATQGAIADAGAGTTGQFLGAEAAMEGAQLGGNLAYEEARRQQAQTKGFTGFMGKLAGGLNNTKAVIDQGSMLGTKLFGSTQAV